MTREEAVEGTAVRHLAVPSAVSGAYTDNHRQNDCPGKNHP